MSDVLRVLLDPILPVFAILAFGFLMGRTGRTTAEAARAINRFAMTVLIPIVLFDLLANAPFSDVALRPAVLYFAVQVVVFFLGYQLARRGLCPHTGRSGHPRIRLQSLRTTSSTGCPWPSSYTVPRRFRL